MTKVQFYDRAEDSKLRFAVIITKTEGHWVFCKHKERSTLEVPGGHREPGEDILTTAKRELYEETGIREDDIAGDWMTFVRPDGATVRLMAWDTREGACLAWAMCDSADYWDVGFVPMAIPSDFNNTVVVNGKRYQTTDEILGVLLQYVAARHLGAPLVYERAVVERDWHDQPGWASYESYADAVLPKG